MAEQPANYKEQLATAFRKYGRKRDLRAGGQIFFKGDTAQEIYYLEEGRVRAYLLYPDGEERTLCYVERGNLVGEEAVAIPPRRIVCADAATDIKMTALSAEALFRLSCEDSRILQELTALFMQKIELLSNWIFYGQFSHNEARIACFLYDNSKLTADIAYTQGQIAAVTGMSRVSVSKCIGHFEQCGLIQKGYGSIHVLRRDDLRAYFYGQEF